MSRLVNGVFMAQGLILLGNGLYMLACPDAAAQGPQLAGTPRQVMTILSTSTVSLAAYYIYAAWAGNRGMMKLSIVGRAAATAIFWRAGGALRGVSAFEAVMGAITGLALWAKPEQGSLSRSV